MVRDVVPELLAAIRSDFDKGLEKSPEMLDLLKVLADGLATHKQSNQYAILVGELLAKVLSRHVTADSLPDGRMYYNIADRVLNETLERNHELVTGYAGAVQGLLNEQAGLGLVVKVPEPDRDRVDGLVNKVATAEDFERVKWVLQEPVVNFSQSVVDKTIRENVDFHASVGLTPKIVRKGAGNCCKWCQALIGTFEYGKEPKDVYRRHERCRCTVQYVPDKNRRQNVHTREWTSKQESAIIKLQESTFSKVQAGAKNYFRDTEKDYLKNKRVIRREEHTYRTYDTIKNSNQDIEKRKIYSNIGQFKEMSDFTKKDVDIAFDHVFNDLHDLDFGRGLFPPDEDMAESWSRLISGKGIEQHDLLMLRHERLEHDYMYVTKNLSYDDAHRLTNETYDYGNAVIKYKNRRK